MLHFSKPPRPSEYWREFVANAAVRLAREVGWPAELVEIDGEHLEIDCGGSRLIATNFGRPVGHSPTPGEAGVFVVPSPPEIALSTFTAIFGAEAAATVIAPVGRYASPVDTGMIDTVAVSDGSAGDLDIVTVGHSRCWVLLATLKPSHWHEPSEVNQALRRSEDLSVPPPDVDFRDTAQLCEALLDQGWASGLFPLPVVMACRPAGGNIKGWLAATEASTILALADTIGDRAAAPAQHRPGALAEAWKSIGYRP